MPSLWAISPAGSPSGPASRSTRNTPKRDWWLKAEKATRADLSFILQIILIQSSLKYTLRRNPRKPRLQDGVGMSFKRQALSSNSLIGQCVNQPLIERYPNATRVGCQFGRGRFQRPPDERPGGRQRPCKNTSFSEIVERFAYGH